MRAFALNKESYPDYAGGQLALPPEGRTMDVGALLREHDGVLVTTDQVEAASLAMYPALVELDGDDLRRAVAGLAPDVTLLGAASTPEPTRAELAETLRAMGLPTSGSKAELADRIAAQSAGVSQGGDA
jgi:hypothetical protein